MKLIKIKTANFKKLVNFEAQFTEGLNIIVGDNAAGKSSLLQAIEASLYGPSVLPIKKDNIATWGANGWKLELTFQVEDAVYTVTRTKSTARLERSGETVELVANGNTPVTQHIEELIGLTGRDYNLFMQSKQGETAGVLTFGATALNRKVEQVAGIELIDQVQTLAQEQWRVKKGQADVLRPSLEEFQSLESRIQAEDAQMSARIHTLRESKAQLDALPHEDAVDVPDWDLPAMRASSRAFGEAAARSVKATDTLMRAQDEVMEAYAALEAAQVPEDDEAVMNEAIELGRSVLKLRTAIRNDDSRLRELARLEAQRDTAHTAFMAQHSKLAELQERQTAFAGMMTTAEEDNRLKADSVAVHASRHAQALSLKSGESCPTCGTVLADHDPAALQREIDTLAGALETAKVLLKTATEDYAHLKACLSNVETELAVIAGLEREAKKAATQYERELADGDPAEVLEVRIPESQRQLDILSLELAEANHRYNQLEGLKATYTKLEKRVAAAESNMAEASRESENADARLNSIPVPPSDTELQEMQEQLDAAVAERHRRYRARTEAKEEHGKAEREVAQSTVALATLTDALESLKNRRSEAVELERGADQGSRLSRFLRERRVDYLQSVWDAVMGAASKQVVAASGGMVTRLVYDSGEFKFEEGGVLAPVASASGAQKAHIGVALRVGLSRALYGRSALLIFDEPTESMREHHAAGLTASLAGAASQCLLITHREQDQDLAANIIEVA